MLCISSSCSRNIGRGTKLWRFVANDENMNEIAYMDYCSLPWRHDGVSFGEGETRGNSGTWNVAECWKVVGFG